MSVAFSFVRFRVKFWIIVLFFYVFLELSIVEIGGRIGDQCDLLFTSAGGL